MSKLQNECYELLVTKSPNYFRLRNVSYKMSVTSCWLRNVRYKMLGYEMIRVTK